MVVNHGAGTRYSLLDAVCTIVCTWVAVLVALDGLMLSLYLIQRITLHSSQCIQILKHTAELVEL